MSIRKICLLGLDDYAMLTGDGSYGHIGGESVQHVVLARAWRDLGLDVSIIVHDHGQPRITNVDGIRVLTAFRPGEGVRMLRFVHPRVTGVTRAMREADADIYYQSPASGWSGIAAWFAKRFRKRSVLRIASDIDCMRGKQVIRHRRDRWLFDYGVLNSSLVAAQTGYQRQLLSDNYSRHSEIVNIAVELPAAGLPSVKDVDVIWVGNLREMKRPDLAVELARRLPQYRFALIGGSVPEHRTYFDRLVSAARHLPNMVVTGPVAYQEVGAWFARSRVHLNTSDVEGFPNTFLQAWSRSVPVVSFFDPDGLIERRGLGRKCRDLDEMTAALDGLLRNDAARMDIGARARAFASSEFSARSIAARYLELLELRMLATARAAMPARSFEENCE
jgi:glycosyltransferase involved in cell wall biosynthesis